MSDDGRLGLTIIGFIGSVFSPYYARARRRAGAERADPREHCAINVALYGDGRRPNLWTMTERGRASLRRDRSTLAIGPSAMCWDGDSLVIRIDEVTAPLPSRVRGEVRLHPVALSDRSFALDDAGRHRWRPIAPSARVEVSMRQPGLNWSGTGYFDSNAGDRALEDDFTQWDWSRAALPDGRTAVLYDVARRNADALSLALCFDTAGGVEAIETPPRVQLPRTAWHMERATRSEPAAEPARLVRTLEDAPFYVRSTIESQLMGQRVTAVHESLSLDRFTRPWCQWMLPFRMPRNARWP